MRSFPRAPQGITVEWLTGALREAGVLTHAAGAAAIASTTIEAIGDLGLHHHHGGTDGRELSE